MNPELEQRIRERAYEIWEFRIQHGMLYILDKLHNLRDISAQDDWLEAEEEILEELNSKKEVTHD